MWIDICGYGRILVDMGGYVGYGCTLGYVGSALSSNMIRFFTTKIQRLNPPVPACSWRVDAALHVLQKLRKHDAMCVL